MLGSNRWWPLLSCGVVLMLAGSAAAETAREHYDAGRFHVQRGEYDDAIREFEASYQLKPLPLLLFNIGQVARSAGKLEKAVDAYQLYLRQRPDAPERQDVKRWIAEMRETIAARKGATAPDAPGGAVGGAAAPAPAAAPTSAAPAAGAPAAATATVTAPVAVPPSLALTPSAPATNSVTGSMPPPAERPVQHRRSALWITLGTVGGALVVGAVVTGVVLGVRHDGVSPGFADLGIVKLGH